MRCWPTTRRLRALVAPLVLAGAFSGLGPTAASAASCQSRAPSQPLSPGTAANDLRGVAVLSRCNVWAVGEADSLNAHQTLVENWNGSAWTVVASDSPGASGNALTSVRAVSARDIWAVGASSDGDVRRTLIERYTGSAWTQVPAPSPGAFDSVLNSVRPVSAKDVWAVGNSQASIDAPSKTLVLRWNGSAWRQMSSPSPGFFNKLSGVAATSSHDVWTVGSTFAKGSEVSHTLIEHWNGRQWGRASLPKTGDGSELSAVGATSPTNVWAVGQRRSGNMNLPLFLHWNGTKWKQAASPAGVSGALGGVYVISARNAWAAGSAFSSGKADKALLLHWNGSKWTRVSRPGPAATGSELAALAASSAANVWAVGNFRSSGSGSLRDQALALHCC